MNAFRFTTVMITALSMAMAFSHLLQLPPRMSFDGQTWRTTQQLFPLYAWVGAPIELGAVFCTAILTYLTRRRRPVFGWSLACSICLAIALGVWILFVSPVNAEISQWSPTSIPPDWQQWRAQWEYAHAARAVLAILGLGFLVQSLIAETRQPEPDRR